MRNPLPLLLCVLAAALEPQNSTRELQAAPVVVEVYYSQGCGHCLDFIRNAVVQLLQARLSGDAVRLTVFPMPFNVLPPDRCANSPDCYGDLAPLCAMKATEPHPTRIDEPALLPAVEFLACDLAQSVAGEHLSANMIQECAAQAGVSAQPLLDCARSEEVRTIMFGEDYSNTAPRAVDLLVAEGFAEDEPFGMPLVFIAGALFKCAGGGCTAWRTPKGEVPLPNPGSLLSLVCARLSPQPAACVETPAPAAPLQTGPTPACENCEEILSDMRVEHEPRQFPWLVVGAVAAAIPLAGAAVAWRRWDGSGYRAAPPEEELL